VFDLFGGLVDPNMTLPCPLKRHPKMFHGV
jgi:hypothetical protein